MDELHLGPTGHTVAAQIAAIREARQMTFASLSAELDRLGHPIPTLGLRRIESRARRVNVDDLVAIAVALNVSPQTLLMSQNDDGALPTALPKSFDSSEARAWMRGDLNLTLESRHDYWLERRGEIETALIEADRLAASSDVKAAGWARRRVIQLRTDRAQTLERIEAIEELIRTGGESG
ncbi:hypothetical protein [Microbacterium sp. NPDC089696]|uniref:hypothetical protein n=1 Tax=Microbacterium sp. NPDC089696 TaxID=3364199 RepID=UPI003809A69E